MHAGAMQVIDNILMSTVCFAAKLTSRKLKFYQTDSVKKKLFIVHGSGTLVKTMETIFALKGRD